MPNYPYTFQLPPLNVQDIPNDGVAGEFLGINGSGQLDWLTAGGGGTGDMLKADNLSGLASYPTARTNLGLGTGDSPTFANLTLTSPSLSSSAPVTISQTWDQAATLFTALRVNATSTNSLTTSRLLDLQAGGVTKFNVDRTGNINVDPTNGSAFLTFKVGANTAFQYYGGSGWGSQPLNVMAAAGLSVSQGILQLGVNTVLLRDGADNTLALRNGAAAQTFRVYNTYSNAGIDVEYLQLSTSVNGFRVGTNSSGSGSSRPLFLGVGGGSQWQINTAGHIGTFGSDNLYDIGASGANRPRNIYVGTAITAGGGISGQNFGSSAGGYFNWATRSNIFSPADGVIRLANDAQTDFNRLQFGGTSSSFPAIKRNAAGLQIRLADDSANATLEAGNLYASGNVGIGTTAPLATLHVNGADVDQDTKRVALFQSNDSNINANSSVVGITSADLVVNTFDHRLLDLDFAGAGAASTGTCIRLLRGGVERAGIGLASDEFVITTGATEKLRVSAAGNVGIGTTSPTSKLHVVGDAVLTGQLLGSDYTVGTVATATQANISITNNHAGQTNSSVVISPKGTGAFILGPKPDGTAVGGNARGNYAVDHQLNRSAAAEVASGPNSCIGGGQRNVASGAYSVVAGGQVTVASGTNSFAGGGLGVTASGSNSFAGGGQTNTASGAHSVVTGGTNNTASESFSFVYGGRNASANRYALGAHSAGQFSQVGDAQKTTAVFRNKTTTNSAVELFLDGASARYTVTSGKIISMLINITGTKSDGSAVAHYVRQYSIKNIGGTTSQVYAAVTVGTDNAAGTSIAISADDTNDSLKIEVTGVASETWRWVASVDAVEVGHGT